jgi:hypothetical protein
MLWALALNLQCESSLTPEPTWDPTLSKVNHVDWQFTEIFGLHSKRWAMELALAHGNREHHLSNHLYTINFFGLF